MGITAPQLGVVAITFSKRNDDSGWPGTTSCRLSHVAEGFPTRRASSPGEARSRNAAGSVAPWHPACVQLVAKMSAWIDAKSGEQVWPGEGAPSVPEQAEASAAEEPAIAAKKIQ